MKVLIDRHGTVRCLYDEAIDLQVLGRMVIHRASQVEPDANGCWWADLAPIAGPRLGPFVLRSQALAAERVWLEWHWLSGDPGTGEDQHG
jgi:hypothetical protein